MTREDAKNRIHRHVGNGLTQALYTVDAIFDHFESEIDLLKAEKASLIDKNVELSIKYSNAADLIVELRNQNV